MRGERARSQADYSFDDVGWKRDHIAVVWDTGISSRREAFLESFVRERTVNEDRANERARAAEARAARAEADATDAKAEAAKAKSIAVELVAAMSGIVALLDRVQSSQTATTDALRARLETLVGCEFSGAEEVDDEPVVLSPETIEALYGDG